MKSVRSSPHECLGREAVLELLKKRVLDLKDGYRQNVALLGHPYIGKSSILHHFISYLKDEQVAIVYLDFEHPDLTYFVKKLSFSLLSQYAGHKGFPVARELKGLLETMKKPLPQTTAVIQDIMKHLQEGKASTALSGLLTLPEVFSHESGCFCVMMLDEFQNIDAFEIPQAFQKLGKKIMTQTKCFYVLASSYPAQAKKILSEDLSLLFGNFEVVELDLISVEAAAGCLNNALQGAHMSEDLKRFLIDFCGGHPLYLQMIGRELKYLAILHQQKEIFLPLLSQAVENTLLDRLGLINRHFDLLMMELSEGKINRLNVDVLLCVADGCNKRELIEERIAWHKTAVKSRLSRLVEAGVIVKNGDFYFFKDKLFRYWLKFVYARRFKALDFDGTEEGLRFREDFQAAIEAFTAETTKNTASRIMGLLHAMEEGTLDLNGRRYSLPQLRDVVPLALERADGRPLQTLKASSTEEHWLIALKDSVFDEEDVNSLVQEIKRKGRKPLKCVIIALDQVDEQAKLKALDEKCWIWRREDLNALMGLFDKPVLVK